MRVHLDLTAAEALHFAHEMRDARSKALADAEGWQELIFVFERLVKFMTGCQLMPINRPKATEAFMSLLRKGQRNGPQSDEYLDLLRQQVVDGRNSKFHGGAAARRFAQHCVELSLLLEEGLMDFMQIHPGRRTPILGSVMSSPVVDVETWQVLSEVRRQMLENSFTWIPVRTDGIWRVISDHALINILEKDRISRLSMPLGNVLQSFGDLAAPNLRIFNKNTETNDVSLLEALRTGPVLVSAEEVSPDRILGIVTAFDLL